MSATRHIRTQDLLAPGFAQAPDSAGPQRARPALIGKYDIDVEIGHSIPIGVFRGFDRELGRLVTLKVLSDLTDRSLAERFRREVATAASLRHGNIITIYELGDHAGQPFAAMQYLGEDDLRQAIQAHRPFTLLQKMLIMWRLAEGIRAAHDGGLACVGMQPSGIALGGDGSVTIQDFGIVRQTGIGRDDGGSYAAPEEGAGNFLPDPLCDIFAYGVIYYELLTGTHPFPDHKPAPLRQCMPECPEALQKLVERALDCDRDLRYQSVDEIQYDAEPILRDLKRERAAALSANARRLMDAHELDDAHSGLRAALELDPTNRKALKLSRVVHSLIERRNVRSRQEALLREAEREAAARRFARAAEILRVAVRLDSSNLAAASRLEQIRAQHEQSQRAARLVVEARQLLDQQDLTGARGRTSEALEKDPQSAEGAALLQVIDETIERREKEARVERELAKAKSLLQLESFSAAISILAGLRAECPESPDIEHWLAHARTRREDAELRARLQAQLTEARLLLAQHRFSDAVTKLEASSAEFPEEAQLGNLLIQAQALAACEQFRLDGQFEQALEKLDGMPSAYAAEAPVLAMRSAVEEQWQAAKTAALIRPVLDEADWLVTQDRPDLAAQFLREKSADFPDNPTFVARLAAIEEMLLAWEQSRFIQGTLAQAAVLEQHQQWPVALTLLEEAIEAYPSSAELLEASERLRRLLNEQERGKKLARRLELIEQKITAGAWSQALSLIEAAQTEFPEDPTLQPLLEEVQEGLKRSRCENIVAEVRQCLADGETNQAEEILRAALESLHEEPALRALQEELEADRKYQDEWRRAQVLFGKRQFEEAEAILAPLAAQNRPDAQALLEASREARAASQELHFYNRGREKALKLVQEHHLDQAADLLLNLLSLFPGDPILERDLQSIRGARDTHVTAQPTAAPSPVAVPSSTPAVVEKRRISFKMAVRIAAVLLLASAGATLWTIYRKPAAEQGTSSSSAHVLAAATPPSQGELENVTTSESPVPENFQVEPKLIAGPELVLPAAARERGIYGGVNLVATVDNSGAVTNVTILSGHPLLASAATTAIMKRRYQPAALNGEPLESKVRIQVTYRPGQK